MTYAHSIKFIIELLVLLFLYIIARKQGGQIKVLEERAKGQVILKARLIQPRKQKEPSIVFFQGEAYLNGKKVKEHKEPSFKTKLDREKKRMNECIPSIHDQLIRKVKKSKNIK